MDGLNCSVQMTETSMSEQYNWCNLKIENKQKQQQQKYEQRFRDLWNIRKCPIFVSLESQKKRRKKLGLKEHFKKTIAEKSPDLVKDNPTNKKLNKFYTGKPKEIYVKTHHNLTCKSWRKRKIMLETTKIDGTLLIGNTNLDWRGFLIWNCGVQKKVPQYFLSAERKQL